MKQNILFEKIMKINFKKFGLGLVVIFLIIIIQIRNSKFLSLENINDLFSNTAVLAILTMGMMIVLVSGGIDLSIASILALVGMAVSLIVSRHPNINPIIAILLALVFGSICGAFNGFLITWGGVSPIITTLGTMSVYRGITFIISNGVWVSAHQMTASFKGIAIGKIFGINNLIVIALIVLLWGYYFLFHTRTGRSVYAIGSNPSSAVITGINKNKITFLVYVIMGTLAGLGGLMWVTKFASAQGDTAIGYEFKVISACVLGGVSIAGGIGKMFDVLMGIIIIGILDNALPLIRVSPFWQYYIQGMVILLSVIINVLITRKNQKEILKARVI